jgi:hypothetical protein
MIAKIESYESSALRLARIEIANLRYACKDLEGALDEAREALMTINGVGNEITIQHLDAKWSAIHMIDFVKRSVNRPHGTRSN